MLRAMYSTGPVEYMIEIFRNHSRNVKRFRDGIMALRWAAAGMEAARDEFRRVKGYRQIPELAAKLEAPTSSQPAFSTRQSQGDGMINPWTHRHQSSTEDVRSSTTSRHRLRARIRLFRPRHIGSVKRAFSLTNRYSPARSDSSPGRFRKTPQTRMPARRTWKPCH